MTDFELHASKAILMCIFMVLLAPLFLAGTGFIYVFLRSLFVKEDE